MISAQFKQFNTSFESVGNLNALFSDMRPMKEGFITDYPILEKKYPELLRTMGLTTIPELRARVATLRASSLDIANVAANELLSSYVDAIIARINSNNENAVVPAEVMDQYIRSPRLKDRAKPDLLYRLLMIPGNQNVLANMDGLIMDILSKANQHLTAFAAQAGRDFETANLVALATIKGRLESIVEDSPMDYCNDFISGLGIVNSGSTFGRMSYTFDLYRQYGKQTRVDTWYPNWFEKVSKLPLAGKLFGGHPATLTSSLQALVMNVEALGGVVSHTLPPFVTELYVELMEQVRETIVVVNGLVEMRSLFINNYRKIEVAMAA